MYINTCLHVHVFVVSKQCVPVQLHWRITIHLHHGQNQEHYVLLSTWMHTKIILQLSDEKIIMIIYIYIYIYGGIEGSVSQKIKVKTR